MKQLYPIVTSLFLSTLWIKRLFLLSKPYIYDPKFSSFFNLLFLILIFKKSWNDQLQPPYGLTNPLELIFFREDA